MHRQRVRVGDDMEIKGDAKRGMQDGQAGDEKPANFMGLLPGGGTCPLIFLCQVRSAGPTALFQVPRTSWKRSCAHERCEGKKGEKEKRGKKKPRAQTELKPLVPRPHARPRPPQAACSGPPFTLSMRYIYQL